MVWGEEKGVMRVQCHYREEWARLGIGVEAGGEC
jgi:hypothetical protein